LTAWFGAAGGISASGAGTLFDDGIFGFTEGVRLAS